MISPEDLDLFQYADDPASALALLQSGIAAEPTEESLIRFASSAPG